MESVQAHLDRRLLVLGVAFALGSALHVVDHLRRGQGSISDALYGLGNISLVFQVATITLILTGHRLAPLAAAVVGPSLAVGFFAAHWLPRWSAISDPVWEIGSMRPLSAIASISEIVAAMMIGVTGFQIALADSRRQSTGGDRQAIALDSGDGDGPA